MADNSILQALAATIFTWLMTALGASTVFFFTSINRRTATLSYAVMMAMDVGLG